MKFCQTLLRSDPPYPNYSWYPAQNLWERFLGSGKCNNLVFISIGSRMKNGTRVSTQQSKPSNSLYSLFHSLFSDTGGIFRRNNYPSYLSFLWCKKSEDLIPPAKCWRMRLAYPLVSPLFWSFNIIFLHL